MALLRQLTDTMVASHRKTLAAKQKYQCPICKGSLAFGLSVLDHSHKTGHVRAALCNSCNQSEGKVLAGVLFKTPKGNLAYTDKIQWVRNLANYWEHHESNPSGVIHPTFDLNTGKQKPVKRRK